MSAQHAPGRGRWMYPRKSGKIGKPALMVELFHIYIVEGGAFVASVRASSEQAAAALHAKNTGYPRPYFMARAAIANAAEQVEDVRTVSGQDL